MAESHSDDSTNIYDASITSCIPIDTPSNAICSASGPSPADDNIIMDMRTVLANALRMPSHARWVADWLFANCNEPFHDNITLPPESFQTSFPISMRQELIPTHVMNSPYASDSTTGNIRDSLLLFVPVAHMDGKTVGYSFGRGDMLGQESSSTTQKSMQTPDPFAPRYVGRFAYDTIANECVIVVHLLSAQVTAICGASALCNSQRRRYFFTVPRLQYSFHNLPSRPFSMTTSLEQRVCTAPKPSPSNLSQDMSSDIISELNYTKSRSVESATLRSTLSGSIDGSADTSLRDDSCASNSNTPFSYTGSQAIYNPPPPTEHMPAEPDFIPVNRVQPRSSPVANTFLPYHKPVGAQYASGNMPWILNDENTTADGICMARNPGRNDTSNGAFNSAALQFTVHRMDATLNGYFVSTNTRHDTLHPGTGVVQSQYTGCLKTSQLGVDDITARSMCESASLCYYACRMSPTIDCKLISSDAGMEQLLQMAQVIMPGLIKTPVKPRGGAIAKEDVISKQKRSKQAREERRRVMNRLSAARSNDKKRQELEKLQSELSQTKQVVMLLTEKRKKLMVENSILRQNAFENVQLSESNF